MVGENTMPIMIIKNTFVRPSVDVPFYDEDWKIHGDFHRGQSDQGFVDFHHITWSEDLLARTFTRYTLIETQEIGNLICTIFRTSPDWYEFFIAKIEYNTLHNIQHLPTVIEFYDSDGLLPLFEVTFSASEIF